MQPNIKYIVTKESDDGTFEVGNHFLLLNDGSILCDEAQGWIDKEDVDEAIKGMEVKVDEEWVAKRKLAMSNFDKLMKGGLND